MNFWLGCLLSLFKGLERGRKGSLQTGGKNLPGGVNLELDLEREPRSGSCGC